MTNLKLKTSYGTYKLYSKLNKKKGIKMPLILIKMLLPVAIQMIKVYIKSTDSIQDDKVLDIVKDASKYLSEKDNNTLTTNTSYVVSKVLMK